MNLIRILIVATIIASVSAVHALTFDFIYDPADPILSKPTARAAAEAAAMSWIKRIDDPVTVRIKLKGVDFNGVDANGRTAYGYTPRTLRQPGITAYESMRNAMIADENAESDINMIVGQLPTLAQFGCITPGRMTVWNVLDEIWATSANMKALNIGSANGSDHIDGTIEFNAHRNWDYVRDDGVTPPQFDFEAMLTHEIGHVLGFQSSIDQFYDWYLVDRGEWVSEQNGQPFSYTGIAPMTLDMFRFGLDDLPDSPTEFSNNARNLNPFQEDITASYLVLDPITWAAHAMEPGFWVNQDRSPKGKQASHWLNRQSGSEIGIMDAVMPAGLGPNIKDPDWLAMDVIGWDVVSKSTSGRVLWNGSAVSPSSAPAPPTNLRINHIE